MRKTASIFCCASASIIESLESRQLLSSDLGALDGRAAFRDTVGGVYTELIPGLGLLPNAPAVWLRDYSFTLDRPADVDVQLANFFAFPPNFFAPDIRLQVDTAPLGTESDIGNFDVLGTSDNGAGVDEKLHLPDLPAGTFRILVVGDINRSTDYDLAVAADFAGGTRVANGTTDFDASASDVPDLGTLASGSQTTGDFIGYLSTSDKAQLDRADCYRFNVPATGTVGLTVTPFVEDSKFVDVFLALYRDANHDQLLSPTEFITSVDSADETKDVISRSLAAGDYVAIVENTKAPSGNADFGGRNYSLKVSYSATDNAPNTIATSRDIGTLDNPTRSFDDYLSSSDTVDLYKFQTVAGGPFVFQSQLTGTADGSNFAMDLIRGSDNGVILSTIPADQEATAQLSVNGTYFVKVRRISGEGPYTLSMSNRNLDLAGNSFVAANDIGLLQGHRHFADMLSSNDTDDFLKFRINIAGTVSASIDATAKGTDADLQLFNENASPIISSGHAGSGAESFATPLTNGTYFLLVHRVAGAPTYDLNLALDTAGSFAGPGRTIVLPGNANEFVGPGDPKDVFKITLPSNLRLGAQILFVHDPINLAIGQDANSNGVLDAGEKQVNRTISATTSQTFANLVAGSYLVEVTPAGSVGTNYGMDLATAPFDHAGNGPAGALDMGVLGAATQGFSDFVGVGSGDTFIDDLDDFYKFTVGNNGPYLFHAQLTAFTGSAHIDLIRDGNVNQRVDAGEVIASTNTINTAPAQLFGTILVPGTYYIHVLRVSGQVSYSLMANAASLDAAGNSLAAALDLHTLSSSLSTGNQFVGRIDNNDFFKFNVTSNCEAAVNFTASATSAIMEIINDANGNGVIDTGEMLTRSLGVGGVGNNVKGLFLSTGTYFLHVFDSSDANYSVNVTRIEQTPFLGTPFVIDPNIPAGTRIEVENFDNGGEGIAYHDTDPADGPSVGVNFRSNEGVDLRNTNDAGGGLRLATTKTGEFLEYSIFVSQTSTYAFDFRVSSRGSGAAFHIEVDDADMTGRQDIPDTGDVDNMTTITRQGIPLLAGPHIVKLVMDAQTGPNVNPDIAGTYNFIQVRPASTGTFALTPASSHTNGHGHAVLTLQWTVPFNASWRTLKTVELRLTDEQGDQIWIRFDEAANTFSLFDADTGKFGKPKTPGSKGQLKTGGITLHMETSSVHAAGPTSPTVVLTLDLSFEKHLDGRHFLIEAAAQDDLGRSQPFALAGILDT